MNTSGPISGMAMMHPLQRIRAVHDLLIPKTTQMLIEIATRNPNSGVMALLRSWESADHLAKALNAGMGVDELADRLHDGDDPAEVVLLHLALKDLPKFVEEPEHAKLVPADAAGVAMVALQCWIRAMVGLARS